MTVLVEKTYHPFLVDSVTNGAHVVAVGHHKDFRARNGILKRFWGPGNIITGANSDQSSGSYLAKLFNT